MPTITSIKSIGFHPVYNMTVDKHSNFLLSNGIVVHNCDALRYFCISRTLPTDMPTDPTYPDDEDEEEYDEYMTGGCATDSYLSYGQRR